MTLTIKDFLLQKYSYLTSYLETTSDKDFTNKIYTISNKDITITIKKKKHLVTGRSEENGFSQIKLIYHTKNNISGYDVCMASIRIETNVNDRRLTIFASKSRHLEKADYIFFGNSDEVYISKNNDWLNDEKYYCTKEINFGFGKKVCYEYNIDLLLYDQKIYMLSHDQIENQLCIFTGSYNDGKIVRKEWLTTKPNEYVQMNKFYILPDKKMANLVYFCYYGCRFTNRKGTIPSIANEFFQLITGTKDKAPPKIVNKLYRALRETYRTGKAVPAVFKLCDSAVERLKKNIYFNPELLDNENRFFIFFSHEVDYDIIEHMKEKKTENIKDYQKDYYSKNRDFLNMKKRVRKWLATHNGEANPKWNDEELECAKSLVI